jgi:hypothetical protein
VLNTLQRVVDDRVAGDPMSPLRWIHKSTRSVAKEVTRLGHPISHVTASRLLFELGYSLQVNAKSKEGRSPETRDAQFLYINEQVKRFQAEDNPVLSVDAKKKEKVGDFKNPGRMLGAVENAPPAAVKSPPSEPSGSSTRAGKVRLAKTMN